MTANLLTIWYLVASVCFILALKGLSRPESARRGNAFGIAGMVIAIVHARDRQGPRPDRARDRHRRGYRHDRVARVQMTQMPELVAAMHSLVGMAAVLIAVAAVNNPARSTSRTPAHGQQARALHRHFRRRHHVLGVGHRFRQARRPGQAFPPFFSAPVVFKGQHVLNLVLGLVMIGFGVAFFMAEGKGWTPFIVMTAIAFLLGFLIIIPIGGADMPVVISMLNSYSGWAAAGIGFSLNNTMLIIAGSLVGSSGAILSYIMCRAMNRSFISVILGGFGAAEGAAAAGAEQKTVRSGSADDAAFLMANAESVIIVPGYGLAVARAQHAVKEMAHKLARRG